MIQLIILFKKSIAYSSILLTVVLLIPIIGSFGNFASTFFSGKLLSDNGETNILIMGIGGEGHESPNLTDSLFLISLNPKRNIKAITIPRDLWLEDRKQKINAVFSQNGSISEAKSVVSGMFGVPVHYAVVISFENLIELIDTISPLKVNVKATFTDNRYPLKGMENAICPVSDTNYNCRYESITFNEGVEEMSSERVLKYIRSRHSENLSEGTDFARSQRQISVINAFISRVVELSMQNPQKLIEIYTYSQSKIKTDLTKEYYADLAKIAWAVRKSKIDTLHLSEDNILHHPGISKNKFFGSWVLLFNKNPQEVSTYIRSFINN